MLPVTTERANRLRNRGYAAFLSGTGLTRMVLGTIVVDEKVSDDAREIGIKVMRLRIGEPAKVVVSG